MIKEYKKDLQKSQKCENIDDPIDVYFAEPLGMVFARLFIKLKMTPNMVTTCSLITGVIGGACLFFQKWWINLMGIFFIILASVFDCSDGQVARLTNRRSLTGRWYDGIADGIVYGSIYLALGLRLMNEYIPFTQVYWGFWIWLLVVPVGVFFHSEQARMADYFRNTHMCFVRAKNGHDCSRSKQIEKEYNESKGFTRIQLKSYLTYTRLQEKRTPMHQKLFEKIENNSQVIPNNVREYYAKQSEKIVKLTTLLTFNLRTYVLFVLILFKCHVFIFPFVLFVLEGIKLFITHKYEKIAKTCTEMDFSENEI